MIRRGINDKNYQHWKNEIFIKLHGETEKIAGMKSNMVCQEQEIEIFKSRIIKLEKKLTNLLLNINR